MDYSYFTGEFNYTNLTGSLQYLLYFIHRNITRCDDTYVFSTSDRKWRYCDLSFEQWQSVKGSIASLLYMSSHFINFCCDGDLSLVPKRINAIRRFYQTRDYDNLVNQYDLQTYLLYGCSNEDTSLLYYLYDNVFERSDDSGVRYFVLNDYEVRLYRYLTELPYFRSFISFTNENYNKSVKHKVLNDLNEIFC